MTARDLFGLALRLTFLFLVIWGVWYLLAALNYLVSVILSLSSVTPSFEKPFSYFIYGFPAFLAGAVGLRYAETLVNFTYRAAPGKPPAPPPCPGTVEPSLPPRLDTLPPGA